MINILITGANGFLGTHVKNQFAKETHKLNLFTPRASELNLLNFWDLIDYCWQYKIDQILHMAAVCGGISANSNNPAHFVYANTQMALNIYEAARKCQISYVYSLGSVCSYPKYCTVPFKEDDIWNGAAEETNFPYGQAKRTLMMLGQTYRQQYGIKGSFLIPGNMYGSFDHFNTTTAHVIPALIMKFIHAKENDLQTVECWGSGKDTSREFLYAEDCAEIIAKVAISEFDCKFPINIGTGQEIKIFELAHLIAKIVSYTGDIVFNGKLDGQPRRCLDVSRTKELLNWEAKTTLYDGLVKTIQWYKDNRKLYV